jgi:hypothetical protein
MSKCYNTQKVGDRCKIVPINDVPEECRLNVSYCNRDIEMYHKVCDKVWYVDCSRLSKKEIIEVLDNVNLCRYMRAKHTDLCVSPECRNESHGGAVKKMNNIQTYCTNSLIHGDQPPELSPNMKNFANYLMSIGAQLRVEYINDSYYLTLLNPYGGFNLVSVGDNIDEASDGIISAWNFTTSQT